MKVLLKAAFAVAALGFTGATYAAPCGTGLDTTNITINGESADACFGPFSLGNSNPDTLEGFLNTNTVFGGGWDHVVRDVPSGGTSTGDIYQGIRFSMIATGTTAGVFTLTLTDTNGPAPLNLPATFDLVGVLNGGNNNAAYYFDDIILSGTNTGIYTITFLNNGGRNPALSHLDILVRDGRNPPPPNGVPEPALVGLLGIGILAAASARRRRKQGA